MILPFLLIIVNTMLMMRIFKSNHVHNFLKVLIGISYFGWSAVPLLITLTGYQNRISNWDFYLFCANIDQVFFFCTYSIFLYFIRRKRTPEIFVRDDFQYNKKMIRTLAFIGVLSTIYLIFSKSNSDVSYLDGNDITQTSSLAGVIAFISNIGIFVLIGIAIFQRHFFKRSELFSIYAVLFVFYMQHIINGGRIYMFVFIVILLYYALETKKKSVLVYTIGLSIFAMSLLPIMAGLRGGGKMDVSTIAEGRSSSTDDIIEQIYIKTNSVYYGSFVLERDGIAGGGPLVYASSFLALIPRNIMPNKPQPGSKDGTMYGLPSRLSAIYMSTGDYNDISNNGVPVSIESLWALGWVSFVLQIIVSAFVLFLFNGVFSGGKPFFLYCVLSLINFPACNLEISMVQIVVQVQRYAIIYLLLYLMYGKRKNG